MPEVYQLASPGCNCRFSVPVLFDLTTSTIVNNESSELIVMLNNEFNAVAANPELDLYPKELRLEIDAVNEWVGKCINAGVYVAGFAKVQDKYDTAFDVVFNALDRLDSMLASRKYLAGEQLTLADVRAYPTLIRFDAVYYSLYRLNKKHVYEYANIRRYLQDLFKIPAFRETTDIKAAQEGYYCCAFQPDPKGVIPRGGDIGWVQS